MKIKLKEIVRQKGAKSLIGIKLGLFIGLLLISISTFAQTKTITGTIKDETGEPLAGATVQIKNSTTAVIADADGKYSIPAKAGDVLLFSFIGTIPQEISVKNTSDVINVTLNNNTTMLKEVEVSVGYGKMKKRDLTGSIVSVRGDDLKTSPNNNAIKALQGKVPGLDVINSGAAGSSPKLKIRGIATLNAKTDPLFVVDGMLLDNIDFINPNDIVSVEVLKDPSSLAIFGVQGANGVIIITTGRAEKGKTRVKYDGYGGVQYLSNRDKLKLTDASEFTQLYNEKIMNEYADAKNSALANGLPVPVAPTEWVPDLLGKGTDWQSEIIRPALITSHSLSVSKTDDKSSTLLSVGYFKQDGIVKYNSYQRINATLSSDYNVNKIIKLGGNANLSRWDSDPATVGMANTAEALPTYAPYTPKESWDPNNIGSHFTPSPDIQMSVGNPVASMEILKNTRESYGYRGVGNVYAEITFLKDLTFRTTGYFDVGTSFGSEYNPIFRVSNTQKREVSSFKRNTNEYTKYQADFILNYNKKIKEHSIGIMAGYTAHVKTEKGFETTTDSLQGNVPNLIEDFWVLDEKSRKIASKDSFSDEAFTSYISRLSYSYLNKYLFTGTFRADGSSKFSQSNRWGYFYSVGAGWIVTEENFMESLKDKIDFLKLKASYGRLGNDKIGNYLYFRKINPQGQQVVVDGKVYYLPTVDGLVDKNLHWEVMKGFDAGFESSLLGQRLSIDFGYYTKTTTDLLARVEVNASVGGGYALTNAGSMRNSGVEFIVSWRDRISDFSYGISFNGATLKNRVVSIGNDDAPMSTGSFHRTQIGHPVGSFYGYVQDGIFQTDAEAANYFPSSWTSRAGDIRYKDLNGDNKIDEKDRTFIGSSIPNFTYGMTLNLGYKNFDFSVDFNGVNGNKIFNKKKMSTFTQFNFYNTDLDRWHGEGTSNTNAILNGTRGHNFLFSTNQIEDGSYFRIRGVQLGYNVPQVILKKIGISNLRIYANAQNLITFKHNSGFTPEIDGNILDGGVDDGKTFPLPTVYTGGLTLSF